jgi:flagellar biosynthesis/type III secretory pathway protein FliH
MTADPTILRDLVARGLALVKPDVPVTVKLHPQDIAAVEAELRARGADASREIRWAADPGLMRGGFLVEGADRIVDGRLDESLRALYERLAYD